MGVSADRRITSCVDFAERRSQLLYHSEHPKLRGEPLLCRCSHLADSHRTETQKSGGWWRLDGERGNMLRVERKKARAR